MAKTTEETVMTEPEQVEETLPTPPTPPNDNPYWPKVIEETFKTLILASEAFPSGKIHLHYPKKGEEIKVRAYVRKLAFDLDVSPDELDVWSQNNFYVSALIKYCCDNEEPIDWMNIETENRKAEDAIEASVPLIINWRFLFDDTKKTG